MRGCRALKSVIPGPDFGVNKFQWFSRGFEIGNLIDETAETPTETGEFFSHAYEWRLNMKTGDVNERNLTGNEFSMEFPLINEKSTGIRNKYGYAQLVNSAASSSSGK